MTMMNWVQKPPGRDSRKPLTSSSPPKDRNAAVSMAAPSRMMNTSEVVLAVSIITPCSVLSIFITRRPDQSSEISRPTVHSSATVSAVLSAEVVIDLMFTGWIDSVVASPASETRNSTAGQ